MKGSLSNYLVLICTESFQTEVMTTIGIGRAMPIYELKRVIVTISDDIDYNRFRVGTV